MISRKARTSQAQWLEQYEVRSFSGGDEDYTVSLKIDGSWACSCKGWIFHSKPKPDCKHIEAVQRMRGEAEKTFPVYTAPAAYTPPIQREVEQFATKWWGGAMPTVMSRENAFKLAEAFAESKGSYASIPSVAAEVESQVVGEFKVTRKFRRLPQ